MTPFDDAILRVSMVYRGVMPIRRSLRFQPPYCILLPNALAIASPSFANTVVFTYYRLIDDAHIIYLYLPATISTDFD